MRTELESRVAYGPAASIRDIFTALVAGGRTDLVHAHMTAAELAAVGARPWHRAPIVATRHFPDRRGRNMPRFVASLIRRSLADQISISRFVAHGIGEASTIVPNGVRTRVAAGLKSPNVLMLQRLEVEKAPDVGLRAWAYSGLAARGWHLTVAGSGRLSSALRSLASELRMSASVGFVGAVSDVDTLFRGTSILLAPAPREPFGLAVAEAMAYGIPVVAADGGAHPETLGPTDFLFRPGDAKGAAERLRRLADDAVLRCAEGDRLRARQRELFTLERHVDALENVYRSILDLRSR
jgi:glycosyltransferase involved in cell wall biosynthesis